MTALSSEQEESDQYSTDKASMVKQRRRDMHKQFSSDKREALLLQRRTRYRKYNQNLLNRFLAPANNDKSRLSYPQLRLSGQKGITTTEIPPHPQTGNTSSSNTPGVVVDRGRT
ncbi:hypothetical protein R3W88_016896 [Solanum pinnatisectum]|uniref:Uncharacterized protein n=1 Tax=Solanum pinnatisectum TaxID=50273 RepID=A0AAV9KZZ8_9SOLN|nr:hypothetical protein R3W88_016896 [Solanum pinnatisectum]